MYVYMFAKPNSNTFTVKTKSNSLNTVNYHWTS